MKTYIVEWETDYCDNFHERSGETAIEAETEEEAAQKFYKTSISKAAIIGIYERIKENV